MGSMIALKPPDTRKTWQPLPCNVFTSSGMPAGKASRGQALFGAQCGPMWLQQSPVIMANCDFVTGKGVTRCRAWSLMGLIPGLMRGGCADRKSCTFCLEGCMRSSLAVRASWNSTVPPMALRCAAFHQTSPWCTIISFSLPSCEDTYHA